MATQDWVADRLTNWLKKNPDKKPKEAKEKVEGDYGINLKYSKAYSGMELALQLIHGKYEESYQMLFNWKAQMEISSPGSIIEIELKKSGKKMLFKRMFVALKPCTVDLENKKCSCRAWQITQKPCKHALAWILSNRGISIEGFVHEYYSVEKFRAAYAGRVEAMPDRADWPKVDLGFKVYPPKQKRAPGRPRKQRIRGCLEENRNKRKVRCTRCKGFVHFAKT
jgi:hypothetical protein